MTKPTESSSLAYFERACRYTQFALASHPATQDKVPFMAEQLASVERLIAERKQADIAMLQARVSIGFRDVDLGSAIRSVAAGARLVDSADRSREALTLLFGTKTPSEVTRPTGAGIERELEDARSIQKAIPLVPRDKDGVLAKLAPELEVAITGGAAALAQFKAAAEQEQLVRRKVKPLKRAVRMAFDRIEGQLKDLFPGQRDLLASFFLPADVADTDKDEDDTEEEVVAEEGAAG